jgi:hypothetical protein
MTSWGAYLNEPRPQVYRVFDATGRLIYIGASRAVAGRFEVHERLSWWYGLIDRIDTVDYPTMEAAFAAEIVAIQEEQPAFNARHTTNGPVLTEADVEHAVAWQKQYPERGFPGALIDVLVARNRWPVVTRAERLAARAA